MGILFLPLLGATWVLAIMSVSENDEMLSYLHSLFCLGSSLYVVVGYTILNRRVRDSIYFLYLKARGKKVPYEEAVNITRNPNASRYL